MDALETLQNAINKIDKETRTTFKDTFDKLNLSLANSFPKLFGGGHAELILLGDDLLTSGVGIVARPPGKKNASVAQLSGGEKALTAISLVFAFFEALYQFLDGAVWAWYIYRSGLSFPVRPA